MKELSIEEKAKAYDEALERMKSWARGEHPECFTEAQKTAEFIFPELCESKDERIRKELIEFVKSRGGFKQEYIAWLEKQGEQMSDPRYCTLDKLIEADDIYQMSLNDAMVEEAKNKAIEALSKLEISKLLGLEKQGEQNFTDNKEKLDLLNFIRKETGCGLSEANNALLKLNKVLKQHPVPIMDKPRKLKIEWEE